MRTYVVRGVDRETRLSVELRLDAAHLPDAETLAGERGVDVGELHSDSGGVYIPNGVGGYRRKPGAVSAVGVDVSLENKILLVSAVIPLVGFVAGAIRLAQRDPSGLKIVFSAIAGSIVWVSLLVVLASTAR